jgi:O-antigen chain-terminating methyltransferase
MITLLTEALRILKPGGILILETPNPENITVASCTFWLDPTHLKPIPPLLLEFHVRHAGFEHTKLLRLNHPSEFLEHLEPISHPELSAAFHGHMDYAIIARKRE